jgi:DNA-binding beta-propeller fold protein YncE
VTGTSGTCTTDALFNGVNGPAVSYDGQNLYVPSTISDVVHTLYIDNATGALSQRSDSSRCVSETGSSGACIDGKGLDGGIEAIVSPDDKDVYVLGYNSDAISVFARAR